MPYDTNNVFAKILRGELPAQKVYEDADTLAFMDIMPRSEGVALGPPASKVEKSEVLAASAEKIRKAIA